MQKARYAAGIVVETTNAAGEARWAVYNATRTLCYGSWATKYEAEIAAMRMQY